MEHMMTNELSMNANFKFGDAWSVAAPAGVLVKRREPLQKSVGGDTLQYLTAETLALAFALRDSGVADWIKGKGYDVLWEYIKTVVLKLPRTILPRSATFELTDKNGTVLRASIPQLDLSSIEKARIQIREELSDGGQKREICIDLGGGAADD
jgi:hypothetical protein